MVHAYKDVPLARRSHTILMYRFSLVVSSGRPSGAGTFAALASFELFASAVERRNGRREGGKEGGKEGGRVEGRREERRKGRRKKDIVWGRKKKKKGEKRKEKGEFQCQYSV